PIGRTGARKSNPRYTRNKNKNWSTSDLHMLRRLARDNTPAALVAYPRSTFATGMSRVTAYAFSFNGLDGGEIRLASYAGHPLLVVNTASQCGYTPQYAGLQTLWSRYQGRGLVAAGARRPARHSRDRPGPISRDFPDHRQSGGQGQGCASV